jgi:hypothetical protein
LQFVISISFLILKQKLKVKLEQNLKKHILQRVTTFFKNDRFYVYFLNGNFLLQARANLSNNPKSSYGGMMDNKVADENLNCNINQVQPHEIPARQNVCIDFL